jgi:hypothetical protein
MRVLLAPTVSLVGLKPETVLAIQLVAGIFEQAGELTLKINSICDGEHGLGSLHYVGYAFDVALPTVTDKARLLALLKAGLTPEFDVVLEASHFHIEFQPELPCNHYKWASARRAT